MQIMNRYPAIGSPCLQPLSTNLDSGCGKAIYQDGRLEVLQAGVHSVDVLRAEAKEFEGVLYELEGDAVKSFREVDL